MQTKQIHFTEPDSLVIQKNGAPPVPRPPARMSSRHSGNAARTLTKRYPPTTWLNLVCLDAPLVSIAWLWLFAHSFQIPVPLAAIATLFLTAWLIYLADRLADSCSLRADVPRSLRHDFCRKHRRFWIISLGMICAADATILWFGIGTELFKAGAIVGALALIHLLLNNLLGGAWPPLPLKEVVIGTLFAAGTLVPLYPAFESISTRLIVLAISFAGLCTLNCISIAFWERELDEIQDKISFATRFPRLRPYWGRILIACALTLGVIAIIQREVRPILVCASASAFFLASLDLNRANLNRDERTALADLVLLTPLLAILVLWR